MGVKGKYSRREFLKTAGKTTGVGLLAVLGRP